MKRPCLSLCSSASRPNAAGGSTKGETCRRRIRRPPAQKHRATTTTRRPRGGWLRRTGPRVVSMGEAGASAHSTPRGPCGDGEPNPDRTLRRESWRISQPAGVARRSASRPSTRTITRIPSSRLLSPRPDPSSTVDPARTRPAGSAPATSVLRRSTLRRAIGPDTLRGRPGPRQWLICTTRHVA